MNYSIRELKRDENKILDTFLYEAILFLKVFQHRPKTSLTNQICRYM